MSKVPVRGEFEDGHTSNGEGLKRRDLLLNSTSLLAASALLGAGATTSAQAQQPAPASPSGKQPNIVFIMGDDIGMWNIGAYHRGLMAGRTPNIDKLAAEGMLFTDYYAEASCTAGRAQFITGELPIRTGMTTVGQAGSPIGIPPQAVTIATVLKSMGYATGQFGKNHLGDLNEFLPTVHGFDEFFGYLYHLDAMEDPAHPGYPQELLNVVGPRNMVHSWATDMDDPTVMPRWGKIGKQKIEDAGTLYPKRMETVDDEIRDLSLKFIDRAKAAHKPFFLYLNPTRMHIVTHLSPKYEALRNSENGWTIQEAGMAQLDDIVGSVMKYLKDNGLDDNTMVMFTTDNGTEAFTWPDGGTTPFYGAKGTGYEGGFRIPMMVRWPGHVPAGKVESGIISVLDWLPTFAAAAGNPNIKDDLLKGAKLGDQTYKYQFIVQPGGWLGTKDHPDVPLIANLRLDPFEKMGFMGADGNRGSYTFFSWFIYEAWRFVFAQQVVGKLAMSAIDYPPMQKGSSFNLDAVK